MGDEDKPKPKEKPHYHEVIIKKPKPPKPKPTGQTIGEKYQSVSGSRGGGSTPATPKTQEGIQAKVEARADAEAASQAPKVIDVKEERQVNISETYKTMGYKVERRSGGTYATKKGEEPVFISRSGEVTRAPPGATIYPSHVRQVALDQTRVVEKRLKQEFNKLQPEQKAQYLQQVIKEGGVYDRYAKEKLKSKVEKRFKALPAETKKEYLYTVMQQGDIYGDYKYTTSRGYGDTDISSPRGIPSKYPEVSKGTPVIGEKGFIKETAKRYGAIVGSYVWSATKGFSKYGGLLTGQYQKITSEPKYYLTKDKHVKERVLSKWDREVKGWSTPTGLYDKDIMAAGAISTFHLAGGVKVGTAAISWGLKGAAGYYGYKFFREPTPKHLALTTLYLTPTIIKRVPKIKYLKIQAKGKTAYLAQIQTKGKPRLLEWQSPTGKTMAAIKTGRTPITDKGMLTLYRGVGIEWGQRGTALVGRTQRGWALGTPRVDIKAIDFGREGFLVESAAAGKIIRKSATEVYPETELQKYDIGMSLMRATEKTPSRFVEKRFIRETKTLSQKGIEKVLQFAKKEKGDLYGSFVQRPQMPKELGRVAGDIDVQLHVTEEQAGIKAKQLVQTLRKTGESARISKQSPSLIEVKKGTQWVHGVDIHSEGDKFMGAEDTDPLGFAKFKKVYGLQLGQKMGKIEGIKVMPLSEQSIRKGGHSLLRMREKGFAPIEHRAKDIPDYFAAQETLIRSKLWGQGRLMKQLDKLKDIYGGEADLKVGAKPPKTLIYSYKPYQPSLKGMALIPAKEEKPIKPSEYKSPAESPPKYKFLYGSKGLTSPPRSMDKYTSLSSSLGSSSLSSVSSNIYDSLPKSSSPKSLSVSPSLSILSSPYKTPSPKSPTPSYDYKSPDYYKYSSPTYDYKSPYPYGYKSPPSPYYKTTRYPDDTTGKLPPIDLPKKKKKDYRLAYDIFIKRGGKWQMIGEGLPKGKALKTGTSRLQQTLAATTRIIPSGTTALKDIAFKPSTDIFRGYKIKEGQKIATPFQYIQKAKKRLSAGSEVREIQIARRRR